jgi:hypothetical protein
MQQWEPEMGHEREGSAVPKMLQRKSIWCAAHVSAGLHARTSIEDAFHTIGCLLHGADLLATLCQATWHVRSCLFCMKSENDLTATMQVHMASTPRPSLRLGAATP